MRFPAEVDRVFEVFRENGFAAYAVGGCVRDFLLQKSPVDYDITTDALPEEVAEIFAGFRVIPTGLKHGTMTVVSGGMPVEITTFRTEGPYLDNRRPSEVHFSKNIADDLRRRDFTINAIAYSPSEGYIDLFGGKRDMGNRLVRCVGDAGQRFGEDALRLLRALRLAAELGFDIEEKTAEGIHLKKGLLKNISAERIQTEFARLFMSGGAGGMLKQYRDVIEVFLPETKDDPDYANKAEKLDGGEDLSVKLAFLLDSTADNGRRQAVEALKRLKFDSRTVNEVERLLQFRSKKIVPGKPQIMVWMNTVGECLFLKLLALKGLEEDMRAQARIAKEILDNHECYRLDCLSVTGSDLIGQGIAEGKIIGTILRNLLFDVIMGRLPNEKEILLGQAGKFARTQKKAGI